MRGVTRGWILSILRPSNNIMQVITAALYRLLLQIVFIFMKIPIMGGSNIQPVFKTFITVIIYFFSVIYVSLTSDHLFICVKSMNIEKM